MSRLNFIGNVEGRDIPRGNADVIVCDGFVGNICLKLAEGMASTMMQMIKQQIEKEWRYKLGALLVRGALGSVKKKLNVEEYGGAPLLGVAGVALIAHGSSGALAICNAVRTAGELVAARLNEQIAESLARTYDAATV